MKQEAVLVALELRNAVQLQSAMQVSQQIHCNTAYCANAK